MPTNLYIIVFKTFLYHCDERYCCNGYRVAALFR